MNLEINRIYVIRLCSGEITRWRYLGEGAGERVWWTDVTTGTIFNEGSILYAWQIVGGPVQVEVA